MSLSFMVICGRKRLQKLNWHILIVNYLNQWPLLRSLQCQNELDPKYQNTLQSNQLCLPIYGNKTFKLSTWIPAWKTFLKDTFFKHIEIEYCSHYQTIGQHKSFSAQHSSEFFVHLVAAFWVDLCGVWTTMEWRQCSICLPPNPWSSCGKNVHWK